jgi:hypothetical protein
MSWSIFYVRSDATLLWIDAGGLLLLNLVLVVVAYDVLVKKIGSRNTAVGVLIIGLLIDFVAVRAFLPVWELSQKIQAGKTESVTGAIERCQIVSRVKGSATVAFFIAAQRYEMDTTIGTRPCDVLSKGRLAKVSFASVSRRGNLVSLVETAAKNP